MNNTIKIPLTVTTVEETFVEVELPCYTKTQSHFYFVSANSQTRCVQVMASFLYTTISKVHVDLAFSDGYELITKAEYEEQFEKALSILKGETL